MAMDNANTALFQNIFCELRFMHEKGHWIIYGNVVEDCMASKGILSSTWNLYKIAWDKKYFVNTFVTFALSLVFALIVGTVFFQIADSWMKVAGATFQGIVVTVLIYVLSMIVGVFTSAFLKGMFLFLAQQRLQGKLDFWKSVSFAQKRFWNAGLQQIAVQFAMLVLALVVFAPFLYGAWSLVGTTGFWNELFQSTLSGVSSPIIESFAAEAAAENASAFFGGMLVLMVALLALVPFLVLYQPVIFLENVSVSDSLKRAWKRSWKNWKMVWKSVLAFAVVSIPALIVAALLSALPELIPAQAEIVSPILVSLLSIPFLLALAYLVSVVQLWLVSLHAETAEKASKPAR